MNNINKLAKELIVKGDAMLEVYIVLETKRVKPTEAFVKKTNLHIAKAKEIISSLPHSETQSGPRHELALINSLLNSSIIKTATCPWGAFARATN